MMKIKILMSIICFLLQLYPHLWDALWKHLRQSLFPGYQLAIANKKGMESPSKRAGQAHSTEQEICAEQNRQPILDATRCCSLTCCLIITLQYNFLYFWRGKKIRICSPKSLMVHQYSLHSYAESLFEF